MKVTNFPRPTKKGFASQFAKLKTAKKGDDSFKTCSDFFPFEGGFPPIGNIVLENSPHPSTRTRSSRHPSTSKFRLAAPRPSVYALSSSRTRGSKRKTSSLPSSATIE